MLTTIEVVFDGKTFVPTKPVDLPAGTKANVEVPVAASPRTELPLSAEDIERILRGDGNPPPWRTVEEALATTRGEVWPKPSD
jgi:predicted DNA-binding antitoxin AbrB/MazE fold protein